MLGRYLSPEPMLQREPKFAASPAYAYAANNPIKNADPTGLFVRQFGLDECPNWGPALQLARAWAGCSGGNSCNPAAPCQQKLRECTGANAGGRGCDICEILTDGRGPDAYLENGPFRDEQGNQSDTIMAQTIMLMIMGDQGEIEHILVDRVQFLKSTCSSPALVSNLARYLLHEAAHVCSQQANVHISDRRGSCSAASIEKACR